jgi:ParB-like chromosome segregation protein Spo0J
MDLPQVKIGKRTFTILFPDLLRPLTEREATDLRESVRRHGVIAPVIVDENDGVIDGANRLAIAAEVGAAVVPVEVRAGLTHEKKVELAYSLNEDRRHLSPAELKQQREERVARVAEARRGGKSLGTIPASEGVSPEQVRQDVQEATVKGLTVDPRTCLPLP